MSGKWPGGIISKTAPTVTGPTDGEGGSASGIWTLDQAADYEKQGLWPKPVIPRELWTWGYNVHGELGDGTTVVKSSPVQVGALTNWLQVTSGNYHMMAAKADGTAWSWGEGNNGKLGHGNTTSLSSPVQIGALTDWAAKISAGMFSSWAVKSNGTLWAWGAGGNGGLGQGNTTSYSSPVQVGALTDWLNAAGGYYYFAAVKTDGTLWTCGKNNYGQLGDGSTTDRSSPVQVGALTGWLQVTANYRHCGAIKTDGTLWMWGRGTGGTLGDGTGVNKSSPVQVGALTTWSDVSVSYKNTLALKTDGTLWAWGDGGSGANAQGNTTDYSSPVQVGALTDWSDLNGEGGIRGVYSGAVLKSDGTVWAFGSGGTGRLGQGNTTNYSSPVQVGALTTWKTCTMGFYNMAGLKEP